MNYSLEINATSCVSEVLCTHFTGKFRVRLPAFQNLKYNREQGSRSEEQTCSTSLSIPITIKVFGFCCAFQHRLCVLRKIISCRSDRSLCFAKTSKNLKYKNSCYRYWAWRREREHDAGLEMGRRRSFDESTSNEKTSRWLKTFHISLWPLMFGTAPPEHRSLLSIRGFLESERASERTDGRAGGRVTRAFPMLDRLQRSSSSRLGAPPFDRDGPSFSSLFSYARVPVVRASRYLTSALSFVKRLTFATGRSLRSVPTPSSLAGMISVLFYDFLHARELFGRQLDVSQNYDNGTFSLNMSNKCNVTLLIYSENYTSLIQSREMRYFIARGCNFRNKFRTQK